MGHRRAARRGRTAGDQRVTLTGADASDTVDRYREICSSHRWNVPPDFNIAHAVCARHAGDPARVALLWEDHSGATAQYT
jgi:hypothetical protein